MGERFMGYSPEANGGPDQPSDAAQIPPAPARHGMVNDVIWIPSVGDLVFIAARKMPGGNRLTITGLADEVMRESVHSALSLVRSRGAALGIAPDFMETHSIQLDLSRRAVGGDSCSAGVPFAVALSSLLSDVPVRPRVGMMGESTLRGRVLPIGRMKERVRTAHRAGLRRVIGPASNAPDLDDLDPERRASLEVVLVEHIDEAIAAALVQPRPGH